VKPAVAIGKPRTESCPGRLPYDLTAPAAPERYFVRILATLHRPAERAAIFQTFVGFFCSPFRSNMQEYATRFQLHRTTCASLREASSGIPSRTVFSSIRLIQDFGKKKTRHRRFSSNSTRPSLFDAMDLEPALLNDRKLYFFICGLIPRCGAANGA